MKYKYRTRSKVDLKDAVSVSKNWYIHGERGSWKLSCKITGMLAATLSTQEKAKELAKYAENLLTPYIKEHVDVNGDIPTIPPEIAKPFIEKRRKLTFDY